MDGLILVDKPAGPTSHTVTVATKRALGIRRAGHSGTLDPFASGLLLVLVGRARRVQRFLTALPKRYETTARYGAISTTGDPEGEITWTGRIPPAEPVLPTGVVRQRPPIYSAVRIEGRRAYERARDGEDFEVPERDVVVHRFEQVARDGDERGDYVIECSAGTYVRSLIAELGDAYCEQLRRTHVGPFDVADADSGRVLSLTETLAFMPHVRLGTDDGWRAAHGQRVPGEVPDGAEHVLLLDDDGPVAVALQAPESGEAGALLKPVVGFRA